MGDANLTVAVSELRAALGDDAREPRYVRTVHRFGYAFAGEATEKAAPWTSSPPPSPRVLWETRVIPLVEGENVLGRDEGVTVRIDVPGVSRRHACIRVAGDEATIEDLGSKNGTYVGDAATASTRRPSCPTTRGSAVGRFLLVFRSSPEAGSTITEGGD